MVELIYLICWTAFPVPMDCRIVRIEKDSLAQCQESVIKMDGLAPAWCNTGRKPKTIENWLKQTGDQKIDSKEGSGEFI